MYLNGFSVRIIGGSDEKTNGYVVIDHKKTYKVCLRNTHNRRCDVDLFIDGKEVGNWRIEANSSITLERPANDNGKFTFYRVDSDEGEMAGGEKGSFENGLVQARFHLEAIPEPRPLKVSYVDTNDMDWMDEINSRQRYRSSGAPPMNLFSAKIGSSVITRSLSRKTHEEGVTGLSGESTQRFHSVSQLQTYDEAFETTINLRLICPKKSVRALKSVSPRSNPIPSLCQ